MLLSVWANTAPLALKKRRWAGGIGQPEGNPILKKFLLLTAIVLLLMIVGVLTFFLNLRLYAEKPANRKARQVQITIPAGQSFNVTTATLAQNQIIKNPYKFKLVARLKGYDRQLKAGEYALSASMSPIQILQKMVKGEVKLYRLTIPEGLNIHQIADLVAKAGFAAKTRFVAAATDADLARKYGLDAATFEGYLFPETYFFPKEVPIETIVATMVKRFRKIFNAGWQQKAKQLGLSEHQIVILASIIEKETGAPFERPLISSVFHNRLKRKMRLESDPTVIYGLENFDGNLKRKHLETPSPYNTYKRSGLPAGPIANPGKESLEAALYPADTQFIYFVSKKDQTHQFSTNLSDHNRAVRKYQLRR